MNRNLQITSSTKTIVGLSFIAGGFLEYLRQANEIQQNKRGEINYQRALATAAATGSLAFAATQLSQHELKTTLNTIATGVQVASLVAEYSTKTNSNLLDVDNPFKKISV